MPYKIVYGVKVGKYYYGFRPGDKREPRVHVPSSPIVIPNPNVVSLFPLGDQIIGTVGNVSISIIATVPIIGIISPSLSGVLFAHDFTGGAGPLVDFNNPATTSQVDYISDPTSSGRGTVQRFYYTPFDGCPASSDINCFFDADHKFGYGETLWFRGDVYFPSAVVSGGPQDYNHTRKMIDYFGDGGSFLPRFILLRESGILVWVVGQRESGVYHGDTATTTGNSGITILDDTWYQIDVRITCNSADGVTDGILEIYINGASTPTYSRTTGLQPINGAPGTTYFKDLRYGTQLTTCNTSGPNYTQYRYWDNVVFSTTRFIGTVPSNFTRFDTSTSNDVFSGVSGTFLDDHVSDSGHVWYRQHPGSSTAYHLTLNGSGELYNPSTIGDAPEWYICSQRPPTTDYGVFAELVFLTNDITQAGLILNGHVDHDTKPFYQLVFFGDVNYTWKLYKFDGTTFSTVGTWDAGAGAYTNGQVIPFSISRASGVINCVINGITKITFTDTAPLIDRGHPGIGIQAGFSTTQGQRLRNFRVETPGAGLSNTIISHTFNDATPGPYNDFYNDASIASLTYPADPTSSGRGNVLRIEYDLPSTFQSSDQQIFFDSTPHTYRYNEEIWFTGDLYIPLTTTDGVTAKNSAQQNDRRKLIDYFNPPGCRFLLERAPDGNFYWAAGDRMNGGTYHEDVFLGDIPIQCAFNTWYHIEIRLKTNTVDNVRDGILEFYFNNSTSTPSFVVNSGLGWITEAGGPSGFTSFRVGTQTSSDGDTTAYNEYRYWDNVAFSNSRLSGSAPSDTTKFDTNKSYDRFVGRSGSLLQNHVADSGHIYHKQAPGANGAFALAFDGSGSIYNTSNAGDAPEWYISAQRTPTVDNAVSADMIYLTSDLGQPGLMINAHRDRNAQPYYSVNYRGDLHQWAFHRFDGTTFTTPAVYNVTGSYTANQIVPFSLVRNSTSLTVWVGGGKVISYTDSTPLTDRGHPGLGIQAATSPTLGQKLRNFSVVSTKANLAFNSFNKSSLIGEIGKLEFLYQDGHFDIVPDPTGLVGGNVARFFFQPIVSNLSDDEGIDPVNATVPVFSYNYTLWFKGKVFIPSKNSSGANKNSCIRKLLYYKSNGGVDLIVYRQRDDSQEFGTYSSYNTQSNNPANSHSALHFSIVIGGVEVMAPYCGFGLNDDQWYTIEVMLQTNSASGVADGVAEIYIDNSPTPNFRQASLAWFNDGTTHFNFFLIGAQLSNTSGDLFSEYRYWKDMSFSNTRESTLNAPLISHDFTNGAGPFAEFQNSVAGQADFPADPTSSGRGTINRILYSPPNTDPGSSDQNMIYDTGADHYRYNRTIWFKGDLYLPSAAVAGGPQNTNNQRKLIDYFRVNNARLFITREQNGNLHWIAGDAMTGGVYHEDVFLGDTGIPILDDTWYTIEVMMRTNSADGVRDGRLEFYVNNSTPIPNAVVSSGLGWITEQSGGTYFNSFRFGTQLTVHYPTDNAITQYRYWDNVAFSTTRVGNIISNYTKFDTSDGRDIFNEPSGTLLENHISDSGHVWYKQAGSSGFALALASGRVYSTATSGFEESYVFSQRPTNSGSLTANYSVACDILYLTSDQTQMGPTARAFVAVDTRYQWRFCGGVNNLWQMESVVAGTETVIGTYNAGAGVYSANQIIRAKLTVSGSTITGFVDNIQRVSVTNTAISASAHPGITSFATFNDSTRGQVIKNFLVSVP